MLVMSSHFDATLKRILKAHGPDWAAWLAPQFGLPSGPMEAIETELSTFQPIADKVFRLPDPFGLLHLELQSTWSGELPDRIHVYNTLLRDRHGGPVRSVAILLRPEAQANALTGTLVHYGADGQEYLRFRYDVIRIWELPAESLLSGGLGIAPLGLLTNDAEDRLPELVRRFTDRVLAEVPPGEPQNWLLASSYILLGLRYDVSVYQPLFEGVQKMRESSGYQAILKEGREEGREESVLKGLQLSVITLLESRFGSIPAEIESQIRQCTDAERLRKAVQQVLTIAKPNELVL
jgi:predicted transposase YdaD